jgi:drug/metabolite transporter (DMT)-like permease
MFHKNPLQIQTGRTASRIELILAFAAIYLIWGSTYLGIRYAVETIPPLLVMGMRHSVAGALVYAWARRRGAPPPEPRQWLYAAITGAFLFLGSHGSLAWAEQKVPSGLAALLCATLPLWSVLLARIGGAERALGARVWIGLLLGFSGVALLIGPDALRQRLDLLPAATVLLGAFLWAAGTIYSKSVSMPSSTVLSAAVQMVSGGVLLFIAGAATGEVNHFHLSAITARSALSLAYLIVFGSIVAFTAFTWLLQVSTPSMVSTYAYVNPVIAVFVGWAFAGEPLGWRTLLATAVILAGVALVTTRRRLPATEGDRGTPLTLQRLQEAATD